MLTICGGKKSLKGTLSEWPMRGLRIWGISFVNNKVRQGTSASKGRKKLGKKEGGPSLRVRALRVPESTGKEKKGLAGASAMLVFGGLKQVWGVEKVLGKGEERDVQGKSARSVIQTILFSLKQSGGNGCEEIKLHSWEGGLTKGVESIKRKTRGGFPKFKGKKICMGSSPRKRVVNG